MAEYEAQAIHGTINLNHDQTPGHRPDRAHLPGGHGHQGVRQSGFRHAAINLAAAQLALGECGSNYLLLVLGRYAGLPPSKETPFLFYVR